jgi:hypothetical protein
MDPSADDFTLLNELWQMIEGDPTSIYPRQLLIQQLMFYGWTDAAVDAAEELLKLSPGDKEAQDIVRNNKKETRSKSAGTRTKKPKKKVLVPNSEEERQALEEEFAEELLALQQEAPDLAQDMHGLAELAKKEGMAVPNQDERARLAMIQNGELKGLVSAANNSARVTAGKMKGETDYHKLVEIAAEDLVETFERLKRVTGTSDNDALRELLAKRVKILVSSISGEQQPFPGLALMHVEHEKLGKKYVNSESMFGDDVKDIARDEFWVSGDNYAWAMDELAQAIKANGGIMRNPLSKEMFSPEDIKMILMHPTGASLGVLQLEQSQMSKGVRLATIEHLEVLAATVLIDDADDQYESRKAIGKLNGLHWIFSRMIDLFLAYVATLPKLEQDAIDKLRVQARDSHTGQEFDCTIGDAVRDGRANKICMHKMGDLLKQAAAFLRRTNPNVK